MHTMKKLTDLLDSYGCTYACGEKLSAYTTFRIGGACPILIKPNTAEQIGRIIRACKEIDIPYLVVGKGSNLLISDSGIDRVVILLGDALSDMYLEGEDRIVCAAGASLARLCKFALQNELTGMEFAYGIPGTVGGAVYMNAGAYDGEMKDVLADCTYYDENGEVQTVDAAQMELGYRHSMFSDRGCCVTSVTLQLKKADPAQIRAKMDELMERRKTKQPIEYPSAGSTFKRPVGNYAAALIEQCGLKGKTIGGAQVSEKHAGFVINKGGATCADVLELIDFIKQAVFEQTGYQLECEVRIL